MWLIVIEGLIQYVKEEEEAKQLVVVWSAQFIAIGIPVVPKVIASKLAAYGFAPFMQSHHQPKQLEIVRNSNSSNHDQPVSA